MNGKEFDTYKVGTTANSTSTMHKLTSKPITMDCFEIDDYDNTLGMAGFEQAIADIIDFCEKLRYKYVCLMEEAKNYEDGEKKKQLQDEAYRYWKELVRWLPDAWLQTRTVTMTYENLLAMCSKSQRRFHKLNEWSGKVDKSLTNFISFGRSLPYAAELLFSDEEQA